MVIVSTILTWSFFGRDNQYAILVMTFLFTLVIVLIGEIIPKIWAKNNNVAFATQTALFLNMLFSLTSPLSSLLTLISSKLETIFRSHELSTNPRESIIEAVDIVAKNKDRPQSIQDIWLRQAAIFSTKTVSQIMRYRLHIKGLNIKADFNEVLNSISEWGYSRIPIYTDSIDDIQGILYAKDILKYSDKASTFQWQDLLRTDFIFVSPNKNINEQLKDFQSKKTHIAIVVDEFGETVGLVTMEDIVEEIIGEIEDEFEHNQADDFYIQVDERTFIFENYTSLNDFCKILNMSENIFDGINVEIESLAGLILEISGRLPQKGDEITYKNLHFTIEEADNKRIGRVKIQILSSEA